MIIVHDYTHNPLTFIGRMSGICYDSNTGNDALNVKRAKGLLSANHGRTLEFADITIEISGYSNRVMRELYTHIIGVTRLQQSTRYVDMNYYLQQYYVPDSIKENNEALAIYNTAMLDIYEAYGDLVAMGIPIEDVGNLVTLGHETKVILKINLRALIHMFETRTCNRAYHEFRKLMGELRITLKSLDSEWKFLTDNYLVTKCVNVGYCVEAKSCGRYPHSSDVILIDKDDLHSVLGE